LIIEALLKPVFCRVSVGESRMGQGFEAILLRVRAVGANLRPRVTPP